MERALKDVLIEAYLPPLHTATVLLKVEKVIHPIAEQSAMGGKLRVPSGLMVT